MDDKNFSALDDIKNLVQNAINTDEFKRLNQDIKDAIREASSEVGQASSEVKRALSEGLNGMGQRVNDNVIDAQRKVNEMGQKFSESVTDAQRKVNDNINDMQQRHRDKHNERMAKPAPKVQKGQNLPALIATKPKGRVAGVLYTVFGYIGTISIGIVFLVFICIALFSSFQYGVGMSVVAGFLPLLAISILMTARGSQLRNRIKRFRQYAKQLQGRRYCGIKELAMHVQESERFVTKDLKKMIKEGMFPEGHIDEQQTCLMLDAETYRQYLATQESLKIRKLEEAERIRNEAMLQKQQAKQQKESGKESVSEKNAGMSDAVRDVMSEGRTYIQRIREANDQIPGEEFSKQLYRLEAVADKILSYVEQHPDQVADIRKFMSYYLPITLKLVNAYQEFDSQLVQGENIKKAKEEIQDTMDTINVAFENLLDSLFQDAAMNVSADISVLETMLAQEGLTKGDFN